jgi:menaquinone-dependent protoporphyrinogen oxidase
MGTQRHESAPLGARERVLVTWGSRRGGTDGLARDLAGALAAQGLEVEARPAAEVRELTGFDAVIVGGALYANRWHRDARRLVARSARELRRRPTWFFSSGPLDDSATRGEIAPTRQVKALMARVGAQGHMTFGGRLTADARGLTAQAMAAKHAGDWRDPAQVRAWAGSIARALPQAVPGAVQRLPGASWARLGAYGLGAALVCLALHASAAAAFGARPALVVSALLAPIVYIVVAWRYFRRPGARAPLPTALAFAALLAGAMLATAGGWLPPLFAWLVSWGVGETVLMMPEHPVTPARRTP